MHSFLIHDTTSGNKACSPSAWHACKFSWGKSMLRVG